MITRSYPEQPRPVQRSLSWISCQDLWSVAEYLPKHFAPKRTPPLVAGMNQPLWTRHDDEEVDQETKKTTVLLRTAVRVTAKAPRLSWGVPGKSLAWRKPR